MRTAAALVIGNELLSGKIQDQNTVVLARTLRAAGVTLRRVVMVLDEIDTIAAEVKALAATHDTLFTSGGVGPTHDDVTIAGVARAFGVEVERSAEIEGTLRGYYGERMTEGHLAMAKVPAGARLARLAPSMWPAIVKDNVWILPGVPQIFAMKMPLVAAELGTGRGYVSFAVYTLLDEGYLKEHLDRVVALHPRVDVGSYPAWNEPRYRTKLTFDGLDEAAVKAARDELVALLAADAIVFIE
jgi:molybdenum cofactor synthesis domain-containing protein